MRVQNKNKNPNLTTTSDATSSTNGTKKTIHNIFIVDASGSMRGHKYDNAIHGVNEILHDIAKDTDTNNTVTIVEFEGHNIKTTIDFKTGISSYMGMGCGGMTPLNQAIGETLEYSFKKRSANYSYDDKVLVNIFTDGEENSSIGKYSDKKTLSTYILALEEQGFTITFVGTKQEVAYAITSLNMKSSNTLIHTNTAASIKTSFDKTRKARTMYSKAVSKGEDVTSAFYTKIVE